MSNDTHAPSTARTMSNPPMTPPRMPPSTPAPTYTTRIRPIDTTPTHSAAQQGRPPEVGLRHDAHRRTGHEHAPHECQQPVQQAQAGIQRRAAREIDVDIHCRRDALAYDGDAQHQPEVAPQQDERAVQELAEGEGT